MLSVRFLGFDVFGTVVDWRTSIARELDAFLRQHGSHLDPEALADAWRGLYQPSMETVRSGQRPWVRLSQLHEETLDVVLKQHGFDVSRVSREELRNLARGWERLDPWPDAVEGLQKTQEAICHRTDLERQRQFDGLDGEVWSAAVGRHRRRGTDPCVQATTAGLFGERCSPWFAASGSCAGGGSQRRPRGRAGVRTQDNIHFSTSRAWAPSTDRSGAGARLGYRRR